MPQYSLTKNHLIEGIWEGVLTSGSGATDLPVLRAMHQGKAVDGVAVTATGDGAGWIVRVPIPIEAVADGLQTIVIMDDRTGDKLESFSLLAGEALSDDIRAEIDLMRAELDMLKRAFRRHCLETM